MTSTAPARAVDEPTRLRRSVTGPLLFLFILGDVLGAGVYALVGVMSDAAGGMFWLPLVVALGMALLTAASYAELVTKYPRAGARRCSPSARTAGRCCRSSSASRCSPPA